MARKQTFLRARGEGLPLYAPIPSSVTTAGINGSLNALVAMAHPDGPPRVTSQQRC
jgi:hypothetical protein